MSIQHSLFPVGTIVLYSDLSGNVHPAIVQKSVLPTLICPILCVFYPNAVLFIKDVKHFSLINWAGGDRECWKAKP